MSESVEEIYSQIGQTMYDALPDQWVVAWLDVCVDIPNGNAFLIPLFMEKIEIRKSTSFDVSVDLGQCFIEMHSFFQRSGVDKAWNKCRFILRPDGDFNLEFKFDRDLDYLHSLDAEEVVTIGSDLTNAIMHWSGLNESAHRPWVK